VARLRQLNPTLRVSTLKDVLALIGVPKTSRDTKKDCGKPGCPNDHRRQVLARGDRDRMSATSAHVQVFGVRRETGKE